MGKTVVIVGDFVNGPQGIEHNRANCSRCNNDCYVSAGLLKNIARSARLIVCVSCISKE